MEAHSTSAGFDKPRSSNPAPFDPHAPRVRAEPQAPSKKSHLPTIHHRHHHHRHSRHDNKKTVHSAIQLHPPTSFGDLLKQASKSKDNSPSRSRRESIAISTPEQNEEIPQEAPPQRPVRPDDVSRERAIFKAREEELRTAVQSLSEQSLKTSRRLDDTYYTLLEKVSSLRQTIASLQDLCNLTKELHETFESDTKGLVEETQSQFEGFNNFEAQQGQVSALEERIRVGKEQADTLMARLADARNRVESRAKLETEREATISRRLRVLWATLASIVALILIATLFQQLKPLHLSKDYKALDFASRQRAISAPIPDAAKEVLAGSFDPTPSSRREKLVTKPIVEAVDDRLHIFDEL